MSHKINQKRILFIITQSEFGGAQRFLFELIKGIQRGPYKILLAIGCDGNDIFINEIAKLGIDVRGLSQLKRDPHPLSDIAAVWQVRKLVRSWKPDTVFLNSSKAGFLGSLSTVFPFKLETVIDPRKTRNARNLNDGLFFCLAVQLPSLKIMHCQFCSCFS